MRFKFLIIPTVLIFQVAGAQNGTTSSTLSSETPTIPASSASSTFITGTDQTSSPASSPNSQDVSYLDYKSVFEAATVEEEVKMAGERFGLSPGQQDIWLTAAADRRSVEKQSQEMLDSKAKNIDRDGVYRGLRTAHNTFHDIIVGHLTPAQKQSLERDRLIIQEKQKRLAKLPPPPPPAPTVTVAPVDSAAIKAADKSKGKKSKKKKKAGA